MRSWRCLSLDVDVGEGLVDPLPHGNEAVVDHDDPQHEQDDQTPMMIQVMAVEDIRGSSAGAKVSRRPAQSMA